MLQIHLLLTYSEWAQTYFSFTYRNTSSPWSSSLLGDLMVHNNSQEKISCSTQRFGYAQCQESYLSLYFRTYLQTTMKGLFCLMHIFPLERHVKRFRDCPEDSTNLFFTFHIVCSHTVDHRSTVCKPCKLKPSGFFFSHFIGKETDHLSSWLLTSANPHYL